MLPRPRRDFPQNMPDITDSGLCRVILNVTAAPGGDVHQVADRRSPVAQAAAAAIPPRRRAVPASPEYDAARSWPPRRQLAENEMGHELPLLQQLITSVKGPPTPQRQNTVEQGGQTFRPASRDSHFGHTARPRACEYGQLAGLFGELHP